MSLFYTLSKRLLQGFFSAFYAHEVHLPKDLKLPKGSIIAANHASFFDPPLIAASWPEPIHFLARKTLFDVPFLRPLITSLNAHPLNGTNDLSAFKQASALLAEGKNILIFPEGTRSPDGKLAPFKAGVSMLADRTKAPIIPCYIQGSFEAWPKQSRFPKPFGYKTACTFGSPIYPETFGTGKDAQAAITKHLHEEIRNLLERKLYEQRS